MDLRHGGIESARLDVDRTASTVHSAVHVVGTHDANIVSPRADVRSPSRLVVPRSSGMDRPQPTIRESCGHPAIRPVRKNVRAPGPYLNRHRNEHFFLTTKIFLPCAFWRSPACITGESASDFRGFSAAPFSVSSASFPWPPFHSPSASFPRPFRGLSAAPFHVHPRKSAALHGPRRRTAMARSIWIIFPTPCAFSRSAACIG